MTEEEKKAIEHIRNYPVNWMFLEVDEKAIKVVLTLIEKLQKENIKLKQEQAKRSWIHVKENGEVEPLLYISKDKIRNVFDTKIHNFNYLSKTDWDETQRCIDDGIVHILKIILKELLEE